MPGDYLYRTAITRLRVSDEGAERLERLVDAWRVGCAAATDVGWPNIDDSRALQAAAYDRVREESGLKSEHAILTAVHRWAFRTLSAFVEYRARAHGLTVEYVDPSYTSLTCSRVGCDSIDSANPPERGQFRCQACGYEVHADYNAARNVGLRCVRSGHKPSERTGVGQCALKSGTLGPDGFMDESSTP